MSNRHLNDPTLISLRDALKDAIQTYSAFPASAKAHLTPPDLVRLYMLFEHVVNQVILAVDVSRSAMAQNQSYHGAIEELRRSILKISAKQPLPKSERLKHTNPKYRIDHAEVSVRLANCLKNEFSADATFFDVALRTRAQMMRIPNFGRATLTELEQWMGHLGLKLQA